MSKPAILCLVIMTILGSTAVAHAALPSDPRDRMQAAETIINQTPDKYLACHADSDCTTIMYGCGSWAITNKTELEEFKEAAHTISAAIKCAATDDVSAMPSTICEQNKCVHGSR